jgi:hypothetical protein
MPSSAPSHSNLAYLVVGKREEWLTLSMANKYPSDSTQPHGAKSRLPASMRMCALWSAIKISKRSKVRIEKAFFTILKS